MNGIKKEIPILNQPDIFPQTKRFLFYGMVAVGLLLTGYFNAKAQSGISAYHLKGRTIQGANLNAAFMPYEKVVVGLPIISGIGVSANAPFTYGEVTYKDENGNLIFDDEAAVNAITDDSFAAIGANLNLLYIGIRPNRNLGFSFSVRQRLKSFTYVDAVPLQLAVSNNTEFENTNVSITRTLIDTRYFQEYGVGMVANIPGTGIEVGGRFKVVNGIANLVSERNLSAEVDLNEFPQEQELAELALSGSTALGQYSQSVRVNNAALRTAGVNFDQDGVDYNDLDEPRSHLFPNRNFGLALDLGLNWQINSQFSMSTGINDLGYIRWKEQIKNYEVKDASVQIDDFEDIGYDDQFSLSTEFGSFYESAIDSLEQEFQSDTTNTPYTTGLGANIFASGTYHLSPKDELTLSARSYFVQDRVIWLYGAGYTRKCGNVLALSTSLIGVSQNSVDVGIGMAVDFSIFQFYATTDRLLSAFQYKNAKDLDVTAGLVFVFGRGKKGEKASKYSSPNPGNEPDYAPRPGKHGYQDYGIYQKTRLRKQPNPYKYPKKRREG